MRRNKFVNYPQKRTQSCLEIPSNMPPFLDEVQTDKIFNPIQNDQRFKSYELLNQKIISKNFKKQTKTQLKNSSKSKEKNNIHFIRKRNFSQMQFNSPLFSNKKNQKFNKIDLQNMPGAAYKISGITIYRSKNIRSLSKLERDKKIQINNKFQKRKMSVLKNQESFEFNLKNTLNSKTQAKNFNQKCQKIYNTYIPSKSLIKKKDSTQMSYQISKFQIQQPLYQNVEDILCNQIIQSQIYSELVYDFQQQFF